METARHGSELRGLADVDRSSLANGRFGRLFAGCDPAKHSERVLNELAKTMIHGEVPETSGLKGARERRNDPPAAWAQAEEYDFHHDPLARYEQILLGSEE